MDVLYEIVVLYLQQIIQKKYNQEVAPFSHDLQFGQYKSSTLGFGSGYDSNQLDTIQ